MSSTEQLTQGNCFHSQSGQDQFVDEVVFRGKRNGVFVEIGASDGVTFSNSLYFERHRAWTGLCVEPIPSRFEQLKRNRRCACVQGCVGAKTGIVQFTVMNNCDLLSGISPKSLGGDSGAVVSLEVPVYTPSDVFSRNGIRDIDLCSIDTEGTELEILKAMDFSRWAPRCLIVEDNGRKLAMIVFLWRHGYRLIRRLGADLIFAERSLAASLPRGHLLTTREIVRRFIASTIYRMQRCFGRSAHRQHS